MHKNSSIFVPNTHIALIIGGDIKYIVRRKAISNSLCQDGKGRYETVLGMQKDKDCPRGL